MKISPEPKDSNDNSYKLPEAVFLEFLKQLMGEDGLTFLNLDNAITAVKQAQTSWQAPFAIGLWALPLLYQHDTDSPDKHEFLYRFPPNIDIQNKEKILSSVLLVFGLSSQIHSNSYDKEYSKLIDLCLEALESQYNSLTPSEMSDENLHLLFHVRFALGVLLLLKGDEERATKILREMVSTKTRKRGQTWSSEGLEYLDIGETKLFAAIVLQGYYAERHDYNMGLYLLSEAVASSHIGYYSKNLLAFVPSLLESFADKCERGNDFGEWFEGWVDLFDRAAAIIEICGEADTNGDSPSICTVNSPQFLSWKYGQLVARFAIRYSAEWDESEQLLPTGYSGEDWGNGTIVASLLCEYEEHRDWQNLRQQCVSMWESSSRYQWLSLCQAGTWTDLYWAVRIGFAEKMLEITKQRALVPSQTPQSPVISDIEITRDIASTIAIRQMKELHELGKLDELLSSLQVALDERLPSSKADIHDQLQKKLSSVWDKIPAKVMSSLVKAERYYKTEVDDDQAKGWFNRAVEASIHYCLRDPFVSFRQKRGFKKTNIAFAPRGQNQPAYSKGVNKLSLFEWSLTIDMTIAPINNRSTLELIDLKRFLKEYFGDLPVSALKQLHRSLQDFCLRKDSQHDHPSRYEEEIQELKQMRDLALGINRPSIITQIFQLFATIK